MTALQLSRVEQGRLYTSMINALGVPDQIDTQRLAAFEARAYAFVHLQPFECLEAYVLADVLDNHTHLIGAELYSIKIEQVETLAQCQTDTAKHALRFLGLFKSPLHGHRVYTNDPTGCAGVLELPPDLCKDWRSLDW